jgi:hypothetical protein
MGDLSEASGTKKNPFRLVAEILRKRIQAPADKDRTSD